MNGKFLLVFMLALNIVTLVFGATCIEISGTNCQLSNNLVLSLFLGNVNENSTMTVAQLQAVDGISYADNFTNASNQLSQEQGGAFGVDFTSFLDAIKMILGFLTLLTPLPIISFAFSLGLPIWISIVIILIPGILYVLAILELVRGASF
jgi:hypothetical protein